MPSNYAFSRACWSGGRKANPSPFSPCRVCEQIRLMRRCPINSAVVACAGHADARMDGIPHQRQRQDVRSRVVSETSLALFNAMLPMLFVACASCSLAFAPADHPAPVAFALSRCLGGRAFSRIMGARRNKGSIFQSSLCTEHFPRGCASVRDIRMIRTQRFVHRYPSRGGNTGFFQPPLAREGAKPSLIIQACRNQTIPSRGVSL